MKNIVLFFIVSTFIVWLLIPIPMPGDNGLYNPISGLIWCRDRSSCLHEIGHSLDRQSGWISHSRDFGMSVQVYVMDEFESRNPGLLAQKIVVFPGAFSWNGYFIDTQSEIYATIFQSSSGQEANMPAIFRKFYDWNLAKILMAKRK